MIEPDQVTLPRGTVTFLFSDIEGSTRLLQELKQKYPELLHAQQSILRQAFIECDGEIVDTRGEEFFVAFPRATDAVTAAVKAQQRLSSHAWPDDKSVKVRIGIHTGEPWVAESSYVGIDVHRAARLASVGHGGQVLLSETTAALVMDELPEGVSLEDLGRHELKDVPRPEHVRQLIIPGLQKEFPPLRSTRRTAPSGEVKPLGHNLPFELSPFIGREKEVAEIQQRLLERSYRLLTLVGAGGIGKTRLAVRAARDLIGEYPDGIWLVEFSGIRDPELVAQHTAATLDVSAHELPEGQGIEYALSNYLREKNLLLVLDNCEHIIHACAELVESLLRECPRIQILVTSRENLGVLGEQEFGVPAMAIPSADLSPSDLQSFESVALFLERARSANPGFRPSPKDMRAIVEICTRLDGLPLAIELAAARAKILSPGQIAGLLQDRFQLLTGGQRTAFPRHKTLEATLEWSYDLLSEPEQSLFRRLSVFEGGWTLESAEGVFTQKVISPSELLELLSHLVDKSLVTVSHSHETSRYGMLETVQHYALRRLEESEELDSTRDQHAGYFVDLAEKGDPELRGARQLQWLTRLDADHQNFRSALRWLIGSDRADDAARLVAALGWFWFLRGYWQDARRWLRSLLDMGIEPKPRLKAKAICRAGGLDLIQGKFTEAPNLVREALQIFTRLDDHEGMAWCLNLLGQEATYYQDGEWESGAAQLRRSVQLFQSLGDDWGEAWSTRYLGQMAELEGDFQTGVKLQKEALETFGQVGDVWNVALSLYLLGSSYRIQGDFSSAREAYLGSYSKAQSIDDRVTGAHALQGLGMIAIEQEQFSEAAEHLRTALGIMERIGDENCTARVNYHLARIAQNDEDYHGATRHLHESLLGYLRMERSRYAAICLARYAELNSNIGEYERAARLLGAAQSHHGEGRLESWSLPQDIDGVQEALQERMGEEAFQTAYSEGRDMSLQEAVAYAEGTKHKLN